MTDYVDGDADLIDQNTVDQNLEKTDDDLGSTIFMKIILTFYSMF